MSDPVHAYKPLTSENAALVLIDHQVGLSERRSRLFDGRVEAQRGGAGQSGQGPAIADRRHNHCARQHVGPTFPELVEALPGVPIIDCSSVNAFDDPEGRAPGHQRDRPHETDLRGYLSKSVRPSG